MKNSKVYSVPEIFEQETEYCASTGIDYEVFVRYDTALMPIEYVLRDKFGLEYNFKDFSYNDQKNFCATMQRVTTAYVARYRTQMETYLADERAS